MSLLAQIGYMLLALALGLLALVVGLVRARFGPEPATRGDSLDETMRNLDMMLDAEKAMRFEIELLLAATAQTKEQLRATRERERERWAPTYDTAIAEGLQVVSITESVAGLAEQAQVIGEMITTIDDIAETTSDLAPGADIVARGLAEQRHGFQTVAAEIAALANQAKQVTERVRGTLGDIQGRAWMSERKYRSLMENANDAILIFDVHGTTLEANRRTEALLGRTVSEIVGRKHQEFVVAAEQPQAILDFQKLLADGRGNIRDIHLVRQDGTVVSADLSGARVQAHGRAIVLAIVRDMTERNQLQRQILQNEKLVTVGRMAAGIAHEINNPTAALLANLAVIEERVHTTELAELIGDCGHAAERIRDVVRNLKSFAHIDDGEVRLVDINELLEGTIRLAFNEIRHRARIEKDFGPNLPQIVASPGKLGQVFLNLVVNAAHAIDEGRVEANKISITTRLEGNSIRIDIEDSGKGISPDVMLHIFDPFFTTKPVDMGTGLGLTICHDIVQKHKGKIQVSSEVGRGTLFSIRLPTATGLELPARIAAPTPAVVSRSKLLIIDDEESLLRSFQRMLAGQHEVTTALGGRAALELLRREGTHYDVLLCDVMMPEIDGVELHRWIAEEHPGLERRMVFISGGAFTSRAREFLARIDNPQLEKPFSLEQLRRSIATILASSQPSLGSAAPDRAEQGE
jgi:two-component system cell cycle sensor histidine kinase/response regulator CckA